MATIESGNGLPACPSRVAIIGGGRWARVLVNELYIVAPTAVAISIHSTHNSGLMARWVEAQGYGERVRVLSSLPDAEVGAVIVANAARDHEAAVEWALNMRIPTLVEKPIALTASAAEHLARLAGASKVPLAASQVFLFARYLANFTRVVAGAGPIKSLCIYWSDPAREDRYGERKNYDASLPVFADWLPHIVPIVYHWMPELRLQCQRLQVDRGGAAVQLELTAENILCTVRMERNAERRQRVVEAYTAGDAFRLDFSTEPGVIMNRESTAVADPDWDNGKRPVACMLAAFLEYAAGKGGDERLDVRHGLRACRVMDEVASLYHSRVALWLTARLSAAETDDEDVRYALNELLQKDTRLSLRELNRQIASVMSRFQGPDRLHWSQTLIGAQDVSKLLRALAV